MRAWRKQHFYRRADTNLNHLQFEEDWPATNRERGLLIDKNISGTISKEEQMHLDALQAYADYHIDQVAPRPSHVLDELEKRIASGLPRRDGAA